MRVKQNDKGTALRWEKSRPASAGTVKRDSTPRHSTPLHSPLASVMLRYIDELRPRPGHVAFSLEYIVMLQEFYICLRLHCKQEAARDRMSSLLLPTGIRAANARR
jgi:hypothetical protein